MKSPTTEDMVEMKNVALLVACITISGCNSSTVSQPTEPTSSKVSGNTINVCAPNIYFGALADSPNLFINGKKLAKPTKGKNVVSSISLKDSWEMKIEKNFWGSRHALFEDFNVISGNVSAARDIFVVMKSNPNWGGALGSLGGSSGSVLGAAVFGGAGGALNVKNQYQPFTAAIVDRTSFTKTC